MISKIDFIQNTDSGNFFLIAGPCIIESESDTFKIAEELKRITNKLKIPFIFKGSFKKANRTRLDSFTGIGDHEALNILKKIREELKIPVLTDIHTPLDAELASKYVDVLQIPAFLCRQTDLLIAAAKTGKYINIKKGQFLSADSMKYAIEKVSDHDNNNILITERGTMFGYQDLIVDFRAIPIMQAFTYPVILDITHSLQEPNTNSGITGGKPQMIETIAKAGVAIGVDGIFLETHFNPSIAKSDSKNMLELAKLEDLLLKLVSIRRSI